MSAKRDDAETPDDPNIDEDSPGGGKEKNPRTCLPDPPKKSRWGDAVPAFPDPDTISDSD